MSKGDARRREQAALFDGGNEDQRLLAEAVEALSPRLLAPDPASWASACAGWRGGFHERLRSPEGVPVTVEGYWRCRWCFQLFDPPPKEARMLTVWQASRKRGQCRSCRKPIEWATMVESGKHVPLDVPVLVARTTSGDGGKLVDHVETPSHFSTCPEAAQWRKDKREGRK